MQICSPDSTEFEERQLKGFRIRICYEPELETTGSGIRAQPQWTEILGVRASATASDKPGFYTLKVRELRHSSVCLVQVAAVAVGPGEGDWSDSAQICTEALAPEVRGQLDIEMSFRQSAKLKWVTPKDISGAPVQAYRVYLGRARDRGRSAVREQAQGCSSPARGSAEADEHGSIWISQDPLITSMELRCLDPDTSYTVQVAALTSRGLGERSDPGSFTTRSVAPSMGVILPRVVNSYHDHLVLECSGPVPDWSRTESSDVLGFSARYFECSRYGYGTNGAWITVDTVELEETGNSDLIRFTLKALHPERQYVVQVAAVTAAGRGPWSEQSARLSTWRVAPRLAPPIALMHTHDTLVLGWDREVLDDTFSGAVHDESINEFVIKVAPAGKAIQARTVRTSFRQAVSLAQAWQDAGVSDSTDGAGLICAGGMSSNFVAVVPGLSPNQRYVCQAAAVSAAGQGDWSLLSMEASTVPVAPRVTEARVDEVQHNQILVSWEHVQLPPGIPQSLCDKLGLAKSIEDCCLAWSEPWTVEVDPVTMGEGGHFQFAVKDLEPEKSYVLEIRAVSVSGSGAWSRVGENPICTALVAQEPAAPELVYATARALTFSFAGVEDERIIAYEVRRQEGAWRSPSKPLRFDRQSLAVRVTSENRWVVTVDQLKKESTYTLQLRGVTLSGGVTKWSEKSEPMSTSADEHGHEVELSIGVNEESPAQQVSVGPPDVGSTESVEDFSKKLESVLSFTIDQATAGVRLPSVRIPSVAEQAAELLHVHRNDRNAAVKAAARIEDDDTWRSKLPDFLIQQVPVVGCSTVLLRELWRNIRRCALVAHLYGHDTRSSETQALILTCLVPAGGGSPAVPAVSAGSGSASFVKANPAVANPGSVAGLEDVVSSRRETFVRATGLKSAGQVVGLLEVAGRLLASNTKDASTENAAALSSESDDTLVADATSPVQVSLVVFRPLSMDERPTVVLGLLALLLPIFVSAARFVFNKVYPLMAQRMELPLAALVGVLLIMQVLGILAVIWVQQNLENFLSIPATLVFVLYTLIPGISVFLATRSILQGAQEAPFFALLGVFNLASGYLRWAGDLSDDAALDQQPIPRFAACREQVTRWREWLWIGLLIDFVLEEIIGRVCGLHKLRVLGPPLTSTQATLVEYRTLAFAVGLVAAQAQARALVLLQRRSVLLRLLGARKAFIGGITLLLMGAFAESPAFHQTIQEDVASEAAVVQQPRTMTFLREVSPTPWWCCMVLWLRQFGAIAGALVPLVFYTLIQPQSFGRLSVDTLVPIAVSVGCVAGHMFCQSFTALWQEKREVLESDYRVIYLFPHMSSQARQKASAAMRLTLKRGAEATKNTAAEWMATRAVRTGMDFFVRALSRRTALPGLTCLGQKNVHERLCKAGAPLVHRPFKVAREEFTGLPSLLLLSWVIIGSAGFILGVAAQRAVTQCCRKTAQAPAPTRWEALVQRALFYIGMDPTEAELGQINTVQDALDWAGVDDDLQRLLLEILGGVQRVREVPLIHRQAWDTAVNRLEVAEDPDPMVLGPPNRRPLNPVEEARVESFRRVCHLRIGRQPDERGGGGQPPMAPAPHGAPFPPVGGNAQGGAMAGQAGAQPPATTRKLKLSAILDPTLDADIIPLSTEEQARMYQSYRDRFGDFPNSDCDPSADQVAALRQVLAAGAVPFSCFTVFGPFGQRLLRKQTFTGFQLCVATGEWSKKELPGPSSYHSWYQSWRVYRTAMLLLEVADPERLDSYAETIRGFVTQYGDDSWFLIAKADAQMRSEHLERIRRHLRGAPAHGYTEAAPWSACYAMACKDHEYWSKELHTPATLWLARHKRHSPPKKIKTKASRRGYVGADHSQKDDSGVYIVNRRGVEICKNYNNGKCGSAAAQGKCKAKRAHQCNACLGPHQALACPGKTATSS
eukprot:s672_g5.t2